MSITLIMGSIGLFLLLLAYALNQVHLWSQDNILYDVCNFIGGIFLYVYANNIESYPFLIFSVLWSLIAFRDLLSDLYREEKQQNMAKK